MVMKIIGALIGAAVLGCGLYYRAKEKADAESRRIYGIISACGGILLAVSAVLLTVSLI